MHKHTQTDQRLQFLKTFRGWRILVREILRSSWLRWVAVLASYRDKSFRSSDVLNIGGLHTKTDGWLNAAVDFIRREGYVGVVVSRKLMYRGLQ